MRYDFQCAVCGAVEEHRFRMADKPDHVACATCGGRAESIFNAEIQVIVRGGERPFKLDATCLPIGWDKGNTDAEAQERRYAKIINTERKRAVENDKNAIRGGIRKIATVPRELHRMRTQQYGKDYYQSDTKAKLKADGLLFKN